ncbi:hypothetical protein C3L33_09920, partial [Rhododendron williamsianum]
MHYFNPSLRASNTQRKSTNASPWSERAGSGFGGSGISGGNFSNPKGTLGVDANGPSAVTCHKCGEQFGKWQALEAHHLSKHAGSNLLLVVTSGFFDFVPFTELVEGDSQGKSFEEYRETVKTKASKLPKKHPRCLADGNELLRFYGTTVACSLGIHGSSSLCVSEKCCVCQIIRNGFSTKKESKGGIGVFTTSTSARAFEAIGMYGDDPSVKKALIVCRVIAGRVHRPLENIQEMAGQSGFDSLAGKVGLYSNIEELYLLNPKALLPCFVVICKP